MVYMTTTVKIYANNVSATALANAMAWGLLESEEVAPQEVCLCWDTCECALSDYTRLPTAGRGWARS